MPRDSTDAAERGQQRDALRAEVATELGKDTATIREAQKYRRNVRGVLDIVQRDIDLADDDLEPMGVVMGVVQDFKVIRGGTARLGLYTNSREFGDVLLNAAELSASELLVMALFKVPRNLDLDDEDEDEDAWELTGADGSAG